MFLDPLTSSLGEGEDGFDEGGEIGRRGSPSFRFKTPPLKQTVTAPVETDSSLHGSFPEYVRKYSFVVFKRWEVAVTLTIVFV